MVTGLVTHTSATADPAGNRGGGCRQHLKRYRNKGPEQADGKCAGNGAPVQVPQIGVVYQIAEYPEMLMFPDRLGIRRIALNQMFRHLRSRVRIMVLYFRLLKHASEGNSIAI